MDPKATHSPTNPRRRHRTLKGKLILSMLLVGALPLLIGLVMAFMQGMKEIREVNGASFQALASQTAKKLDIVVSDEITQNSAITTDIHIVQALETRRDRLADLPDDQRRSLLDLERTQWEKGDPKVVQHLTQGPVVNLLRQYYGGEYVDPGHPVPVVTRSATKELFITDAEGALVATLQTDTPYLHANDPAWIGAFHKGVGQPYLGKLTFDDRFNTYTFTLALPIMDSIRYQAIGVLHRTYDAKEFFSPSIDTIRFGKTGHVMLIDSEGVVLSCPILPTGTRINDPELVPLVTPMHKGWVQAPSDGHGGEGTSIIGFAPLPNTSTITRESTGTAWHMFVWQSSEELFAPIEHLFTWIAVFGVLAIGLLVILGAVAAGKIVTPIRHLQEAARRIGGGEFQEPVAINTGDEIEDLAEEINRMNRQLQAAFAGLESEVELKTQEVQYLQESTAQILDSVPDPVLMLDDHEQIQYMNRASQEAFCINGHEPTTGIPLFDCLKLDPAMRQKLHREFQRARMDPSETEINGLPTTDRALRDPLSPVSGTEANVDRPEIHFNNRTYHYQWFKIAAPQGQATRVGLVLRDTTEESRLQEQLIQGEKLASLGVLSAGIGHELNNPLVGVIGLGEAIQEEENPDQIKEYAKNIVRHGRRMASIIKDFTGQTRAQGGERTIEVHVAEVLDKVLSTAQQAFESSQITIRRDYQATPILRGNPQELHQAFLNVVTNALQAMQGKGTLDIHLSESDGNAVITIRDTGPGISKSHLPKVFDPFFTTKRQGEGAGLGLTIARRIIAKCGGQIRLESEEGAGTVCHIFLPLKSSTEVTS